MRIINNLIDRILVRDPDAIVSVKDNDYDTLEWHADNVKLTPPSFTACSTVTLTQLKDRQTALRKEELKSKLQEMDGIDKLILKGMFKDLKARNVVSTVDEFWDWLNT